MLKTADVNVGIYVHHLEYSLIRSLTVSSEPSVLRALGDKPLRTSWTTACNIVLIFIRHYNYRSSIIIIIVEKH